MTAYGAGVVYAVYAHWTYAHCWLMTMKRISVNRHKQVSLFIIIIINLSSTSIGI